METKDPVGDFWSDVIREAGDSTNLPPDNTGVYFDETQVHFSSIPAGYVFGTPKTADDRHSSMRALTDKARASSALPLPVNAGTRVAFKVNLGSVLTYPDVPHPACEGTVITVKTATGPATHQGSDVFVLWDDSKFRVIRAEHLKPGTSRKTATSFRMVVSDLGDISSMFINASSGDDLIHKATQDLWSVKKDGGSFVIERLFDNSGKPLKE